MAKKCIAKIVASIPNWGVFKGFSERATQGDFIGGV